MNENLKKYFANADLSLKKAMKKLDESNRKILFVVNEDYTFIGTLTDGDIRRSILNGQSLDKQISNICNKNPITFTDSYDIKKAKKVMLKKRIHAIPIINKEIKIIDLLFWDNIFDNRKNVYDQKLIDIPTVIMAGGKGSRLDPFTRILPKPLIPVGNKSVIEFVIDKFMLFGINNFYVSVHHKANMIKAYFEELDKSYEIKYIYENFPLGTAGALSSLYNEISDCFFLTNCDTIINCDYYDLMQFHRSNKYSITIVGSMINHKVPYGICKITKNGKLLNLVEKPEYSHLVSTGMYVINGDVLKYIPKNRFFNMTDLIEKIKSENKEIGVYPISEKSWLDTGDWEEYKKTLEQLS